MQTGKQYFPLSIGQRIFSLAILAVIVLPVVLVAKDGFGQLLLLGIMVVIAPLIGWCIAIIPRYTEVTDRQIIVKQVWGRLVFDREEVEVAPIGKEALSGSIRTFGNGGLFGYAGFFRNKALGSYRMYITRMKDLAVITDKAGKKTVINLRMPCNATPASTASMEDKV